MKTNSPVRCVYESVDDSCLSHVTSLKSTKKTLIEFLKGLILYGPNSFFRRFSGHNLR